MPPTTIRLSFENLILIFKYAQNAILLVGYSGVYSIILIFLGACRNFYQQWPVLRKQVGEIGVLRATFFHSHKTAIKLSFSPNFKVAF